MIKLFASIALMFVAYAPACFAMTPVIAPVGGLVISADWQEPRSLPPRFRNHCDVERSTGRPYCTDHCGRDYQFFYCSEGSFGCCHLGRGYCDFHGLLRCSP